MKESIDKIKEPISFSDYEKDHLLILSSRQNALVAIFIAISNISMSIALLYALIKYEDLFISVMIVIAACFGGLSEQMLLGTIQRHDQAVILEYELNKEYIANRANIIQNKEKIIKERHSRLNNIVLSSGKTMAEFKQEVHEAAHSGINSDN